MKFITYTILLLSIFSCSTYAQNLVPNSSFEQASACPNAVGQVTSHCLSWAEYTQSTPDYFHSCNTGFTVSVPFNGWGQQPAASGNAYTGVVDYYPTSTYKEYMHTVMTPLQIGSTYEVSMSVSLSEKSSFASNGLGIFFFDNGPASVAMNTMLPTTPQISYSNYGPITDTTNWVRLSATFLADSAYDNLVIGSFLDNNNITAIPSGGPKNESYYYVDSVVVKLAPPITINFAGTQLCAGTIIYVPYTIQTVTFGAGNTFTLQLSDATGSFTAPVNIGATAATTAGSIVGTIPAGTPQGSGYRLRIVSSNPVAISNMTHPITIAPLAAGVTVGSNGPVCAGDIINLTSTTTTSGVSFSWSGPASFSAATQNATRAGSTPLMSGYYVVSITSNGCTAKDSVLVNVHPALNVNATNNGPICTGGTLSLNVTNAGGGANYTWYGPNSFTTGVQNATIPNVTSAAAGTYMIVVNNGPCADTAYTTVTLGIPPATPVAGSNSPLCSGNSISLTAFSNSPGVSYSWTGPGGYNSNAQNPVRANATVAMAGTYTVTAAVGACPAPSVSIQVVVIQTPAAPVVSNNGPLCAGAALDLFATGQPGASYQWNGPGGYNTPVQNPTIFNSSTTHAGTYSATQTLNGCTSGPAGTLVVVNTSVIPAIAVFANPDDTTCAGQVITFVASPNNGGTAPQYQWRKNGNNIAGATAATYNTGIINSGDVFSCVLSSSAPCPVPQVVQSNNVKMTVEPPQPCAVILSANPGTIISPWELVTFTTYSIRSGVLPTYQWLRNKQPIIGATANSWSASNLNNNDTISVVLFSTDPCAIPNTDTSNYLVMNVKTGISSIGNGNGLTLYPNPNKGEFVIKGNISTGKVEIGIFNAIGQLTYAEQLTVIDKVLEHHVRLNATNGIYLLKIKTNSGMETIRFQLEN